MCHTTTLLYSCNHGTQNVWDCSDPTAFAHLCSTRTTRMIIPCPVCDDGATALVAAIVARAEAYTDHLKPLAIDIHLVLSEPVAPGITPAHIESLEYVFDRIQTKLDYVRDRADKAKAMLDERDHYLQIFERNDQRPQSDERDIDAQYVVDMLAIINQSLEDMEAEVELENPPEDLTEFLTERSSVDFCLNCLEQQ